MSWAQLIISGKAQSEEATVYRAILEHEPCNFRKVMQQTGLPINHTVRAINSLTSGRRGSKLAEVAYTAPDLITGRLTQHYQVVKQLTLEL